MKYAKVRLPENEVASSAIFQVMRQYGVTGIRENGEVLYVFPEPGLSILDDSAAPYELLESNLEKPQRSAVVD